MRYISISVIIRAEVNNSELEILRILWHHPQKKFAERYISSLFTVKGCDNTGGILVVSKCLESYFTQS